MHKVFKPLMAALLAGCALVSCKEAGAHAGAPAGAVNWEFTYDHVMLIYGKAVDEAGEPYYLVKNSWGQESGPYEGIWYMSRDYMVLNTTYIYLNREALDRGLLK